MQLPGALVTQVPHVLPHCFSSVFHLTWSSDHKNAPWMPTSEYA